MLISGLHIHGADKVTSRYESAWHRADDLSPEILGRIRLFRGENYSQIMKKRNS